MHQSSQHAWPQQIPRGGHFMSEQALLNQTSLGPQHMNYMQHHNATPIAGNDLLTAAAEEQQQHYESQTTTTVPPPPCITISEVGAAFALQYFRIMKTSPKDLIRFYGNESRVSRISPGVNNVMEFRHATGTAQISELLFKEHGCGPSVSLAIINLIDTQDTFSGGVFLQLSGQLKYIDETSRDFITSILLHRQDHPSGVGYYILNDIFVFQQAAASAHHQVASTQQITPPPIFTNCCTTTASTDQHYATAAAAAALERLSSQSIKPIKAPLAASAHPAAAPLPTTTAPQLSTYSDITTNLVQEQQQSKLLSSSDTQHYSRTPQQRVSVFEVKSNKKVDNEEEIETKKKEEEEEEDFVQIESSDSNEEEQQKNKGFTDPIKHSTIEKENQATSETKDKKVISETSNTQAPPPGSFETPLKRDSRPITTTTYAKNSYAGALLLSGVLPTPCRIGYSIPGPEQQQRSREQQDSNTSTQKKSVSTQQQRMRTLWVSFIPQEMTDDKIKKAVAEQLKGQETEGHVVRIERVHDQLYGYIELDTELCARILVEKGLHLQGREVDVAFLGKNRVNPRSNNYRKSSRNITYDNTSESKKKFYKENNNVVEEGWTSASRRRVKPQRTPRYKRPTNTGGAGTNLKSRNSRTFPEESTYNVAQPVN